MNEDEMRRIRERQEQLEVWARERRQELRQEVLSQAERDVAITAAARTALLGAVPSIVWYLIAVFNSGWEGVFMLVLSTLCLILPFVIVTAAVGVASGLFAHWWFHGTGFSVRRMAIVLALLADAVLFGWVLVLTN